MDTLGLSPNTWLTDSLREPGMVARASVLCALHQLAEQVTQAAPAP